MLLAQEDVCCLSHVAQPQIEDLVLFDLLLEVVFEVTDTFTKRVLRVYVILRKCSQLLLDLANVYISLRLLLLLPGAILIKLLMQLSVVPAELLDPTRLKAVLSKKLL